IVEFDLLGDRHAVVGDGGGAPGLLEHDVAALGPEGDLDGVGELVHSPLEAAPGLLVVRDELGHCGISPVWCGVHPTQCPRRTSASAVFMSHGDDTLTGPECSWSARRRTAGRSCLRERELGAQGAVTLVARVPDHHKHSRAESANPAADGRRRGAQPSSPSPPSPGISTATEVTAESYSSLWRASPAPTSAARACAVSASSSSR